MSDATTESLTEHVTLILDNDEGTVNHVRALVEAVRDAEYPRAELRDTLKDYVEDIAGLESPTMTDMGREMLSTALDHVDWYALTLRYLEMYS